MSLVEIQLCRHILRISSIRNILTFITKFITTHVFLKFSQLLKKKKKKKKTLLEYHLLEYVNGHS